MLKKWVIAAVVLIAIGSLGALFTAKPYFALQNENEKHTKHFASADIQSITVSNTVGTIKLEETSGNEIIVETNGPKTSKPVKIEKNGNSLSIVNEADKQISIGINFNKSSENITVYLPNKRYDHISVSNEVGEITIHQVEAVNINAESELGNIEISNVSSTSLKASSEIGNISIEQYSGKLETENEMGSIEISTDKVTEPIIANNEIGEISLMIEQEPKDIFISADSEIGSKKIFGKNTGSYMNGNGEITVQLKTETGSIQVQN